MIPSDDSLLKRPGLSCRVVQGWSSVFGDGAAPQSGMFGARHIAMCDCCRQFFRLTSELDAALRRTAKNGRAQVTAGLDRRIVEAIHLSRNPAPRTRFSTGSLLLLGVTTSVALGIFILQERRIPEEAVTFVPVAPSAGSNVTATPIDEPWQQLDPEAAALLEAEPLQREVAAFHSDARSALGFLALNFLPLPLDKPPTSGEEPPPPVRASNG